MAVLAGLLLSLGALAAEAPKVTSIEPPQNILFVGNSFTYYNNSLHNHVREMMRAAGKDVGTVRSMTVSGARLATHAGGLHAQLDAADWDVVILQGNSLEAIDADEVNDFRGAVREFGDAIAADGAEPVLFMTWARSHLPEQTGPLAASYTAAGNDINALVVPVGLAFSKAAAEYRDIALRIADRRHPTLAGTYLAACTFYAALFNESPVGHDYDAGLHRDTARAMQTVAWQVVNEYYARN